MRPDDWPAVRDIYAAGIATGNATFETKAPSWQDSGATCCCSNAADPMSLTDP